LELPLLLLLGAFAAALLHLAPTAGESPLGGGMRGKSRAERTDGLTGLPTRPRFERALSVAAKVATGGRHRLAVLFIDLDGFKPVNDTFGHTCGDRVLEEIGTRLQRLAHRDTMAARIGGDEFVMLMPRVGRSEEPGAMARKVIDALSQPVKVEGREIGISCSVGIALFPEGCGPAKLIARADAAMYAAKRQGGSRFAFYSPEMDVNVEKNFDLVRDLRRAFKTQQLELWYQPKIDARSGKVTAAEALLRWNHPKLGTVMPDDFVRLAERAGLIGAVGDWVIEAACRQARSWRDKGLRMRVAINLSVNQMRQDDIVDRITEALKRHKIRPSLLTCEITESTAMEDTRATQETFRRLGELGVHLSIDDFGTGHSSLAYLRKLPAEELKIDRMFVQDLEHSADARAVVDAVVKLAHALGLKVVAEGVENPRQHQILAELGCDELQGYLFAKPMTARALLLWALGDRGETSVFRNSLFGETRQTSLLVTRPQPVPAPKPAPDPQQLSKAA
jgi:diguanylate cyclase (GGDEF)-like protein